MGVSICSIDVPVDDTLLMQIPQSQCYLGCVQSHTVLREKTHSVEVKAEVATEHQINDHKQVLVVLKSITQVDDKRIVDQFQ